MAGGIVVPCYNVRSNFPFEGAVVRLEDPIVGCTDCATRVFRRQQDNDVHSIVVRLFDASRHMSRSHGISAITKHTLIWEK